MNTKSYSSIFIRTLVIAALVIPLLLGMYSPASAADTYTVTGSGSNWYGETTIPADLTDVVAIDAGAIHSLALRSDGTVIAWGDNTRGQTSVPVGLSDVVAISAGSYYNLALKGDGTVSAWGENTWGQATVPPGLSEVVAISAGLSHSMALKADGTAVTWGWNCYGYLDIPAGLSDVVAVAAGGDHSLALKSDGTVVVWGLNGWGQTNIPSGLSGVVEIAAGAFHSLALKSDGTVVAWGHYGGSLPTTPPSGLTEIVAIGTGYYHSLAIKSDGTVECWGGYLEDPCNGTSEYTNVVAAAGGFAFSLALVPEDDPTNTAPTANPGGPYLGAVNTAISFDGSLSTDTDGDPLNYAWTFGDGSIATDAMPAHSYIESGLYTVCLIVNDGSLDSDSACTFAVVYDPSDGFVTGGGWINSPAGAYKPDETLTGQATFGFVAKYKKGENFPSGNTAFEFDLAGMAFASQSYEWLLVNQGGSNAQFKGSGLINGAADPNGNYYKFMLWATDSSPDTFRIRIWWEDADGEHAMYDNDASQAIGGGNIVVHTSK